MAVKTTQQLRDEYETRRKQYNKTTKFEITMQIEVVDVGDVPADASSINAAAIKAVKNISFGDVIQVLESHTSQLTSSNGLTTKKPFGDVNIVPKRTW